MRGSLRVSFTVTLLTAFAALFLVAVGAIMLGYRESGARAALVTAERSLAQAADMAAASTQALLRPVIALSAVVAEFGPFAEPLDPASRDAAALMALLVSEPAVQTASVGFASGALRQVIRAPALAPVHGRGAPPGSLFALREITPGAAEESWTFLGAAMQPLDRQMRPSTGFAPRQTQWYLLADRPGVQVSTLHDLALLGRPGLSISHRAAGSDAVFSLDMTLGGLARLLADLRASPSSTVFLFTEDGILAAHQNEELAAPRIGEGRIRWTTLMGSGDPLLALVWEEFAQGRLRLGETARLRLGARAMLVRLTEVPELTSPRMLVAVAAPLADFTRPVEMAVSEGTGRAVLALLLGLGAVALVAWRITRPLKALADEADAISRLELSGPVAVRSRITEIARLAGTMDGMKSALRVFGAYVPRSLVARLMQEGDAARLGGTRRPISVMFSDVEGFTTLSEGIAPEELMHIASAYFEEVTAELLHNHATIDKYIGDAVMALWNAPQDDGSHALNACRAALRLRRLTDELCERFPARGWPRLRTRFGIHTGEAVVGNLGSSDRMAYTAIGSMVNLASRLEGMNKVYGTRILISEATRRAAGHGFVTRPVDLVQVKGSGHPVELHELLGFSVVDHPGDASLLVVPAMHERLAAWQRMIGAYRAGHFHEAEAALAEAGWPAQDGLAQLYAERLAALREGAPAEWTPVLRATAK